MVVVLATSAGIVLRLVVAHQSLFADELSTYWIVGQHSLGGVMSLMYGTAEIKHAEITPPLFFVLSWLTTQIGHAPELVRAPSLVAGILTIPAVYLVGVRTVGRPAAALAAALTALSPFMIYYSSEARSYAVMMLLTTLSTFAMLRAIETRRARWWVAYAVCSCGAFYTHYTSAFLLLGQLLWLLWAHREARRPALLANLGAAAGVLPWASGLINDLNSPTERILSALSPFTPDAVRVSLEHWAVGFPYVESGGLRGLPGTAALLLLGLAAALAVTGIGWRLVTGDADVRADAWRGARDRRLILVLVLALAVPVGEAIVSAVSTHLFGVRNLAASWPGLALAWAALLAASGPRLRIVTGALAVAAFGLGAVKMLAVHYQRPAFASAAAFVEQRARPGDVVIDGTGVLSPGPLTGLDVSLKTSARVIRAEAPAERDHPFGVFDRVAPPQTVAAQAVAAAHGRKIIVVSYALRSAVGRLPSGYRVVATRVYRQFVGISIKVWAQRALPGR